jgi:hypothetical protein
MLNPDSDFDKPAVSRVVLYLSSNTGGNNSCVSLGIIVKSCTHLGVAVREGEKVKISSRDRKV